MLGNCNEGSSDPAQAQQIQLSKSVVVVVVGYRYSCAGLTGLGRAIRYLMAWPSRMYQCHRSFGFDSRWLGADSSRSAVSHRSVASSASQSCSHVAYQRVTLFYGRRKGATDHSHRVGRRCGSTRARCAAPRAFRRATAHPAAWGRPRGVARPCVAHATF